MKSFTVNPFKVAFLFVMALWLCGCKSVDHTAHDGPIPKGMSIVFGGILAAEPTKSNMKTEGASRSVNVINIKSSNYVFWQFIHGRCEYFYWYLPPGQYAILNYGEGRYDLATRSSETYEQRIGAMFSVDSDQTVIYMGTLDLASSAFNVTDDFDAAAQAFHKKFPSINIKPVKRLLQFEEKR
jgi:hypothetical protein